MIRIKKPGASGICKVESGRHFLYVHINLGIDEDQMDAKIWLLSCKELVHCIFLNLIWHCFEGDLSYFISALLVSQLDYNLLKTGSVATVPFEPPCTAQTSIYSWIPSISDLSLDLNVTDVPRGRQWKVESPWLIRAVVKIMVTSRKIPKVNVYLCLVCRVEKPIILTDVLLKS